MARPRCMPWWRRHASCAEGLLLVFVTHSWANAAVCWQAALAEGGQRSGWERRGLCSALLKPGEHQAAMWPLPQALLPGHLTCVSFCAHSGGCTCDTRALKTVSRNLLWLRQPTSALLRVLVQRTARARLGFGAEAAFCHCRSLKHCEKTRVCLFNS